MNMEDCSVCKHCRYHDCHYCSRTNDNPSREEYDFMDGCTAVCYDYKTWIPLRDITKCNYVERDRRLSNWFD